MILKFRLVVSLIVLLPFTFLGQDWNRIFEYEMDAEYQMAEKQFDKATESYLKALKLAPNSANLKFKIGYCFLKTDDKQSEALEFLQEAAKDISDSYDAKSLKETKAPPEVLIHLGKSYQYNNQFSDAITCFTKYKTYIKPDDPANKVIDQLINDCKNSLNTSSSPLRVKIKNLGNSINDDQSNINPVISGDGLTMAYTTQTKRGYDVFIVKKSGDSLGVPQKINTYLGENYLKTCYLSFDGKELILTLDDPINADLFVSSADNKRWSKAQKLNKIVNSKFNETHACMTSDGNTVYFTSDRKGGYGGMDIYKTTISDNGEWSKAENLGPNINTPFNEETPFLSTDDKILFFSSEGHSGFGGYDIYYTNLTGELKAINAGYPINDSRNNLFYFPAGDLKSGYTSLYNPQGFGKNDIVRMDITKAIKLNGTIVAEKRDPSVTPNFNITLFDIEQNKTIPLTPDQYNNFSYEITPGKYNLSVNAQKFVDYTNEFTIPENYADADYKVEARITPVVEIAQADKVKPEVSTIDSTRLIAQSVPSERSITDQKAEVIDVKKESEIKKEEVKKDLPAEKKPALETKTADVPKSKPKTESKPKIESKPKAEPKPKVEPTITRTTTISTSEGSVTLYSVQIMALTKPVADDFFKDFGKVEVTLSENGVYRYIAGSSQSMEKAMQLLKDVQCKGYPKAFIRIDKVNPTYTIQVMALKNPVDVNYFSNLSDIEISKGDDGFYRYTIGRFDTREAAASNLQHIVDLGYKQAFIKKIF